MELQTVIWTFQCSNALNNRKETDILLYEMLIYKIVRRIVMVYPSLNCNLSCTFQKGNRIINSLVLDCSSELLHVQSFELDPEAPKKVLLTATSKNET
jgi:hypothetical protein